MSQYTIISKYDKRTVSLRDKKISLKKQWWPEKIMSHRRKWKGSHWTIRKRNTSEHKELKPQNMAWKYFKVKTWKLYFDNSSIHVIQSKTMQVETINTFKNYLYIAHPVSSHKIKSRGFVWYLAGIFNKIIIPLAPRWLSIISYPTRVRGLIVNSIHIYSFIYLCIDLFLAK